MPDSDSLYHPMLSHPRMVERLVREFVPGALAAGLDFSKLERVDAMFRISGRVARRREGGVIWWLPTREGKDIFLYLRIEFQGTSDWWMAVRTQVYEGLLCQLVIDEMKLKLDAPLPPLLLLVLNNGVRWWKAATEISELVALSPDSLLRFWQARVRYYLLDMRALPGDKLARRRSLAALVGWFRRHPDQRWLRCVLAELIRQAFKGRRVKGSASDALQELEMMKTNLATIGETWKQRYLAEGRVKGRIEGKAEALVCLLEERFGALAPSWRKRIRGAKLATLECWLKRAIGAPDVPSVFDPPPGPAAPLLSRSARRPRAGGA